MANELRVRTNFVGGLVEDNPLSSGATTLTSAGLASAPAIGSTQHWPIVLDPDGRAGNPEIAYVTAHTAGAQTATITKGQEGTTARAHDRDTPWIHAPTIKDFDGSGGGTGLIALVSYDPATVADVTNTTTSFADVDATNLIVTFTAPPSGKVLVGLNAGGWSSSGATDTNWALRDTSNVVVTGSEQLVSSAGTSQRPFYRTLVTGLTPGTSYTWKWCHRKDGGAGTAHTTYGGAALSAGRWGPAVMEVWAVNL